MKRNHWLRFKVVGGNKISTSHQLGKYGNRHGSYEKNKPVFFPALCSDAGNVYRSRFVSPSTSACAWTTLVQELTDSGCSMRVHTHHTLSFLARPVTVTEPDEAGGLLQASRLNRHWGTCIDMGSQDALKRFLFILTGMDLRSQVSVPNELSSPRWCLF